MYVEIYYFLYFVSTTAQQHNSSTSSLHHETMPRTTKSATGKNRHKWVSFTHDFPLICKNALAEYYSMSQGTHSESAAPFVPHAPTWKSEMTWYEFLYLPLRLAFHRSALQCKWTYKVVINVCGGIDPRVFKPCSTSLTCAICKHYVACSKHEYDGLAEIPDELKHNAMEEPLTEEVLRERGHILGG